MIDIPNLWSVSSTFPSEQLEEMGRSGALFVHEGHFLYPADEKGMHLTRFFSVERVARVPLYVEWIAQDVAQWAAREGIRAEGILAPWQKGVIALTREIARQLQIQPAFWQTLPTGRFQEPTGDPQRDFVEGEIRKGQKVILFNGVTQQGRCVGQRLQDFAKSYGGEIVGLAVFAKGTTGVVVDVEKLWKAKFYATIQVDVPVYPADRCPVELEKKGLPPVPWTVLK